MIEKFVELLSNRENLWVMLIIFIILVGYRYRSNYFVRKTLKPLIINAENACLNGEGKLLKVMQDFRDLTPPFVRSIVSDKFLKKKIEEVLATLQTKFRYGKDDLTLEEIDELIFDYQSKILTAEAKDSDSVRVFNKRIAELEELKKQKEN